MHRGLRAHGGATPSNATCVAGSEAIGTTVGFHALLALNGMAEITYDIADSRERDAA